MSIVYHTSHSGLSSNLGCRSETCCTRLAGNAGPKNAKNATFGHHRTTLSGYIFATKARIDSRIEVTRASRGLSAIAELLVFLRLPLSLSRNLPLATATSNSALTAVRAL